MSERVEFVDYYGEADDFDLAKDPRCLFGWGPPQHGCRHMFGHFCTRPLGHRGRCMDDPHDDACAKMQRPKNWDEHGRAEANR